jgi:hypothetical protein
MVNLEYTTVTLEKSNSAYKNQEELLADMSSAIFEEGCFVVNPKITVGNKRYTFGLVLKEA